MPCSAAMITDVISVGPDHTVADAMALFDKHAIRTVPVIDADKNLLGMFNFERLLLEVLPSSIEHTGKERVHMEISLDKFPGLSAYIAERLARVMAKKVKDVMIRDMDTVKQETTLGEAIRLLALYGSPIAVVDEDSEKLVGLVSSQSAIKVLLKIHQDHEQGIETEE